MRQAFLQVRSPGRLEVVRRSPTVLLDAGHNPGGVQATLEAVHESFGFAKLIGVVAVFGDKDVRGILELMEPMFDEIVVTRNSSPRSMDVSELGALAEDIFDPERVHRTERLDDAIDLGIALADEAGSSAAPEC
nr:hypothetical protein GCM10020093_047610 [Planobispora longispora]